MNVRTAVAVASVAIVAGCAAPPAVESAPVANRAAPVDLLHRAVNLMESRKHDRAIAVLSGLLEQPPADAGATHYLLGSAYAAVNDYGEAATHYALAAAGHFVAGGHDLGAPSAPATTLIAPDNIRKPFVT